MCHKLNRDKNKIPGLSYAYTDDGVELPVLDITHPLFISSANHNEFVALNNEAAQKAAKMKKLPVFLKKIIAKLADTQNTYLSGMRTLILKLGPKLIKGRKIEFWYRLGSKQFNAIAVRMRLQNICRYQAEILIPQLRNSSCKDLCFINIAGGAASDNINTLILIQEEEPQLLKDRKIEINLLEVDTFGPNFAIRCIQALKEPGSRFHGLDISCRHIQYNWSNPEKLPDFLSGKKDWIQICASEGGLFEYGSEGDIVQNLNLLYDNSMDDLKIVGSLLMDIGKINPAIPAGMEISGITLRFIGLDGLKSILKKTKWVLENAMDDGSIYITFTLKKLEQ